MIEKRKKKADNLTIMSRYFAIPEPAFVLYLLFRAVSQKITLHAYYLFLDRHWNF